MPDTGLYSQILQPGHTAPAKGTGAGLAISPQEIDALLKIRNAVWGTILPAGQLRTALLSASPDLFSVFKTLISLLQGRRYYEQEYKLGERLIDQIQCQSVGWRDIPDELVPIARLVFTQLFGVRITSNEDLDALEYGPDQYFARGGKGDISWEQAERAVYLKQHFYNFGTYNTSCWDLRHFDEYPLIGRIPEMNADDHGGPANVGKFYTGPGFNGQQIIDGLLQGTLPVAPGSTSVPPTTVPQSWLDKIISYAKANPAMAAVAAAALGYVIYEVVEEEK